jgi:hypothetical protein
MGKAGTASREKKSWRPGEEPGSSARPTLLGAGAGTADSGESRAGGTRAVSFFGVVLLGILFAASAALSCGLERWAVKTLADPDGVAISQHAPVAATIGELTNRQAPTRAQLQAAENTRFPEEKLTYQVTAQILGYKAEADEDFHIVLVDPRNTKVTMVAEIPSGKCAPKAILGGQLQTLFDALQANFANQFGKPTAKFKKLAKPVCVKARGVGFFDFLHGQTGVAKNGFELHPLLGWDVVSCSGTRGENTAPLWSRSSIQSTTWSGEFDTLAEHNFPQRGEWRCARGEELVKSNGERAGLGDIQDARANLECRRKD